MLMNSHSQRSIAKLLALLFGAASLAGCAAGIAATGGYVAGEEMAEDDNDFDPGEEAIDDDSDDYKDGGG